MKRYDVSRSPYTVQPVEPRAVTVVVALLVGLASLTSDVEPAQALQSGPGFFDNRSTLDFTLRTDLVALLSDRSQESVERPAELIYETADGSQVTLPLQIKTRGAFRLDPEICDFPPVRLNFRRRDVPRTLFAGQDQLKVVTHCGTPDPDYQQYVILEYLVYRIYETLSPKSLRTRLANVTYEDASGTFGAITRYAFLIEDVVDMANRNDARLVEFDGFHALLADEFEMGVFDVFQYMIGNTDWSVPLSQNVEFIEDSLSNVTVVPFDFDWSGAVAPPYAVPAPDVPTADVRERFFMGVCRAGDHLTSVFRRFQEVKEEIYALYRDEKTLTDENRQRMLEYYDEFYATISDSGLADTNIRRACRF